MTYAEKLDYIQEFCYKYGSLIDEAPDGSDLWILKELCDSFDELEHVQTAIWMDTIESIKISLVNAMFNIAENWSNKRIPTIEAEPVRHAHWVFRDEDKHLLEDGCVPSNMWCSYCNQWSDNDSYGDAYCHNCGARMDEPDLADEIAKEESK